MVALHTSCGFSLSFVFLYHYTYSIQVKRGSLLCQPRAVLQKLANISDSNPLAPRNTRGFLFQTLSPEKEQSASAGPKKQVLYVVLSFKNGRFVVLHVSH